MTVISPIRFTTEICGEHELRDVDTRELQREFADFIEAYYRARKVPFGDKKLAVGADIQDSRDPAVGTAVASTIQVYFGLEGEDLDRACNAFINDEGTKRKYPHTWWEPVNESTLRAREERKQARKAYSRGLVASTDEKLKNPPRRATAASLSQPVEPARTYTDSEINDLF